MAHFSIVLVEDFDHSFIDLLLVFTIIIARNYWRFSWLFQIARLVSGTDENNPSLKDDLVNDNHSLKSSERLNSNIASSQENTYSLNVSDSDFDNLVDSAFAQVTYGEKDTIEFPFTLNNQQRLIIHEPAKELNLFTQSSVSRYRVLYLSKTSESCKTYMYLPEYYSSTQPNYSSRITRRD